MARNLKPITGCITPNRGLNSLSPSWLVQCTDTTTATTNPSMNSILDELDSRANSKAIITVSHTCNSDYTCDGVADQVEILEAIAYANTTKLPVFIINDSTYNLTAPITSSGNVGITVDFGYSTLSGTGAIACLIESNTSSVNTWKNIRAQNFLDPFQLSGVACSYKFLETTTCTGSGLIFGSNFSTFEDFYLNTGLTFYGLYSNSGSNNIFNNIHIYQPSKGLILLQVGANTNKFSNMYCENTSTTNRCIEVDSANNQFTTNTFATGSQVAFMPVYVSGSNNMFVNTQFLHSVATPNACIELAGNGQFSVIVGCKISGFTSGSAQQIFGQTAFTAVSGIGL